MQETAEKIRDIMDYTVSDYYGSTMFGGLTVGAKTGTAEAKRKVNGTTVEFTNGFMISFAPANDPEIIGLIMLDEPMGGNYMGGQIAAPTFKKIFDEETKTRFRPSFFPFTEPSVEVDVTCCKCHGKGCSLCKGTGWIEILGAGVVNKNVLRMSGIDPEEYTGFAFGLGLTRLAMMRYGIKDIRVFNSCNLKSLSQFTNRTFIDDEKEGK